MAYRDYSTAIGRIVDPSGKGDFTTIATALTAASSGQTIFIRPGTYTENLTLKAGVNLTSFPSDSSQNGTGKVIINGTCTLTTAGTVTISGIELQTNSAALLAVTGTLASIVNLQNCYLNCTNATGITFSTSSASGMINLFNCYGDIGTTGISIFAHSSAGRLRINGFYCTNTGNSVTASTASAGTLECLNVKIQTPITTSGTNAMINLEDVDISTNVNNATCLTVGGSGTNSTTLSNFNSGTASAISIGSTLIITNCTVSSSNTNAITGAGSITYSGIAFPGTSSLINTTTKVPKNFLAGGISFDAGTNVLSTYTEGTFTPTLVGNSTAGTTTYVSQQGYYTKIGNVVHIQLSVSISAATGTGSILIGGLPFTIKNQTSGEPIGAVYINNAITWPVGTTSAVFQGVLNSTTGKIFAFGTATAAASIQLSNTAQVISITMSYIV